MYFNGQRATSQFNRANRDLEQSTVADATIRFGFRPDHSDLDDRSIFDYRNIHYLQGCFSRCGLLFSAIDY